MTPEGKVKAKITKLLKSYGKSVWYFMPVPSGFGVRTVDYIGFVRGVGFVVEAKREGKDATDMQKLTLQTIREAGAAAFVVNDEESLQRLKKWLDEWTSSDLSAEDYD